jgi:hypothetical protein
MIDKLLATTGQLRGIDDDRGFEPDQAIRRTVLQDVKGANELTLLFPPWHASPMLIAMMQQRAKRNNIATVAYDIDHRVLSTDPHLSRDAFHSVAETVTRQVNTAFSAVYDRINLVGFSIGNLCVSKIATQIDALGSVTMVVPGSELRRCGTVTELKSWHLNTKLKAISSRICKKYGKMKRQKYTLMHWLDTTSQFI